MIHRMIVHLERLPSGEASWWTESPDLEGFSASASSLPELTALVEEAVADIVGEQGGEPEPIDWHFEGEMVLGSAARNTEPGPVNDSTTTVEQVQRVLDPV